MYISTAKGRLIAIREPLGIEPGLQWEPMKLPRRIDSESRYRKEKIENSLHFVRTSDYIQTYESVVTFWLKIEELHVIGFVLAQQKIKEGNISDDADDAEEDASPDRSTHRRIGNAT